MATKLKLSMVDRQGERGSVSPNLKVTGTETVAQLQTIADAVASAIDACSECGLVSGSVSVDGALTPTSVDANPGAYDNREDRAKLAFRGADGTIATMTVPGPKTVSFASDGETVDPLEANMAALIAAVIQYLATKAGAAIVAYISGKRVRNN